MSIAQLIRRTLNTPDFSSHRIALIEAREAAHREYYDSEIFSGPSLFFHLRALAASEERDVDKFTEYTYAVLASWGMHRMGRGGAKMREFDDFLRSIEHQWSGILELKDASPADLGDSGWAKLEKIFRGLRCMATGTSLVGNSKVLAHALPNLVAPIDREYTLRFLFGRTDVKNGMDREWALFRAIHVGFYYPLLHAESIVTAIAKWQGQFAWDTSQLKILDNLVIGSVRLARTAAAAPGAPTV